MSDKDLLKKLKTAIATKGDFVPKGEGWKTIAQWSETFNLSRPRVYVILENGVTAGFMEMEWGKVGMGKKKFYREKK